MGPGALTDELFEVDPRAFVAARDRLAKQLRSDGDREHAAIVKALRRPSVAAWALNQVARHRPAAVRGLLETVEQARTAQDEVLGGGDREQLRTALVDRRHALHAVIDAAREYLERSGRGAEAATREIESALQGTLDDVFVETLRRGELVDLEARGDDDDQLAGLLAASTRDAPTPRVSAAAEARRQKLADDVTRLELELESASARVDEADALSARRERELREAQRERDDAARAHERAVAALERARTKLKDA